MSLEQDSDTHDRLESAKEHILKQVRNALQDLGLHDFDIDSIGLYLKHKRPMQCPPGQQPVWEPVTLPDGSVEYRWVCK